MVFTRALTKVARSIFRLCLLDRYWSSIRPPSTKLMVDQDSDGCLVAIMALSAAEAISVLRAGSRMNLLRCLVRINLSTNNFKP